jgi:hypothetical protein
MMMMVMMMILFNLLSFSREKTDEKNGYKNFRPSHSCFGLILQRLFITTECKDCLSIYTRCKSVFPNV